MGVSERIVTSVYAAMRGALPVPRRESGYCLRLVRIVLENALGWPDEELYRRFPDQVESNTPKPRAFWARDIERSFRDEGWSIPLTEAQPGDIAAYYDAAPNEWGDLVGHIAILMPGDDGNLWVFENIDQKYREGRGAFSSGALSLTPMVAWGIGREIEVFRVPENEAFAGAQS